MGYLYGRKLVSDKHFIAVNTYSGVKNVCFTVVRYGKVAEAGTP